MEECELLYWGFGLHMGRAVSQNTDGDLVGYVRDTGEDPNARGVRLYRTRAEQDFHTDGADVIGLMCLQTAKAGGVGRIASSLAIFNEILERAPDLVPTLFEPFPFDRQGQEKAGERGWFQFPLCRVVDGRLGTFFIPWYICENQDHADAPRLTAEQLECVALIESIANEPLMYLDMAFEPGDIQLLKNSATQVLVLAVSSMRTVNEDSCFSFRSRRSGSDVRHPPIVARVTPLKRGASARSYHCLIRYENAPSGFL